MVRTPPFHGGNTGSNPVGVTIYFYFQLSLRCLLMTISSLVKDLAGRYHITRQALTFIIVGGFSTIISYSTFIIALHQFKLHYLIANLAGFCLSIGFNYQCNKRFTFKAQDSGYFTRYLSLYLISLALSSALLRVFVELCGIIPEIANIITIVLITAFNFSGAKFIVFKK